MSLETPESVDAGADDAPLAFDDAVSLLAGTDAAPEGEAEPEEEEEEQAPDQGEDGEAAPDEDPASEDDPDEDEEAEPAAPAIDAPKFWSAEERALFAKAPPEVQQLVVQKDAEAEKRVYAAKEEAATARKDASVIGEVAKVVDQQLQRAQQVFKGKWDNIDWAQWAREDVQSYAAAKEEFEAEQQELHKLETARTATQAEEHRQFLRNESVKLSEASHVLADPVKGPEEKKALLAYASDQGLTANDLAWAGARELTILHKAMLYDKAQANLKASPPKLKADPTPAKVTSVRPSTPPAPRKETASRQRQQIVGRAFQSGKMDDAVAAVLAMEKG